MVARARTQVLPRRNQFFGGSMGNSETMVGWTAGAGLDYAVTDNLIARVEYRCSDYGRKSQPAPFNFPTEQVRLGLTTNDVRVGFSYNLISNCTRPSN
ncbi:porin family protein [Mesorhizobium sp. WSM4303]|nr:porin family protein [Mesorhizobium sp. WSM4306]TRD02303.1 porin family protein [Mesorhizobium sp. WSM4303]